MIRVVFRLDLDWDTVMIMIINMIIEHWKLKRDTNKHEFRKEDQIILPFLNVHNEVDL